MQVTCDTGIGLWIDVLIGTDNNWRLNWSMNRYFYLSRVGLMADVLLVPVTGDTMMIPW